MEKPNSVFVVRHSETTGEFNEWTVITDLLAVSTREAAQLIISEYQRLFDFQRSFWFGFRDSWVSTNPEPVMPRYDNPPMTSEFRRMQLVLASGKATEEDRQYHKLLQREHVGRCDEIKKKYNEYGDLRQKWLKELETARLKHFEEHYVLPEDLKLLAQALDLDVEKYDCRPLTKLNLSFVELKFY